MSAYTPREGTIPAKVVAFLSTKPEGYAMSSSEISTQFECTSVSTVLRKAVEAGLLTTTKHGNAFTYSLADAPEPRDGTLQIGSWSDGDVTVIGGTPNGDNSITYTRAQIQQLLLHVTVPHIPALGEQSMPKAAAA